ncbi:hypothetical protein Bpla01_49200 [Burkholderia plantarii]|nr:hypothetical protein Bpla01_49200 [Burkholderia plantarii]
MSAATAAGDAAIVNPAAPASGITANAHATALAATLERIDLTMFISIVIGYVDRNATPRGAAPFSGRRARSSGKCGVKHGGAAPVCNQTAVWIGVSTRWTAPRARGGWTYDGADAAARKRARSIR